MFCVCFELPRTADATPIGGGDLNQSNKGIATSSFLFLVGSTVLELTLGGGALKPLETSESVASVYLRQSLTTVASESPVQNIENIEACRIEYYRSHVKFDLNLILSVQKHPESNAPSTRP